MKQTLFIFLATLFISNPMEAQTALRLSMEPSSQNPSPKATGPQRAIHLPAELAKELKHSSQTLLFIMAVASFENWRQNAAATDYPPAEDLESWLKKRWQTVSDATKWQTEGATAVADNSTIWGSLVGSYLTKVALNLGSDAMTLPGRGLPLSKLIGNQVALTLAWDLFGQLLEEAVEGLQDPCDRERGGKLISVLLGSLRAGFSNSSEVAQNDARILKLIGQNLMLIAYKNPNIRDLWLYNTWDQRLATGTTAIGGSVALTLGAARVHPLLALAVGGAVALYTPDEIKNAITDKIWLSRKVVNEARINANTLEIKSSWDGYMVNKMTGMPTRIPRHLLDRFFKSTVEGTRAAREDLLTLYSRKLMELMQVQEIAKGNSDLQKLLVTEIDKIKTQMIQVYDKQIATLGSLSSPILPELEMHRDTELLRAQMLRKTLKQWLDQSQTHIASLSRQSLYGFDEESVVLQAGLMTAAPRSYQLPLQPSPVRSFCGSQTEQRSQNAQR